MSNRINYEALLDNILQARGASGESDVTVSLTADEYENTVLYIQQLEADVEDLKRQIADSLDQAEPSTSAPAGPRPGEVWTYSDGTGVVLVLSWQGKLGFAHLNSGTCPSLSSEGWEMEQLEGGRRLASSVAEYYGNV